MYSEPSHSPTSLLSDVFFGDFDKDIDSLDIEQSVPDLDHIEPTIDLQTPCEFYPLEKSSDALGGKCPPSYSEHMSRVKQTSDVTLQGLLSDSYTEEEQPCRRLSDVLECISNESTSDGKSVTFMT